MYNHGFSTAEGETQAIIATSTDVMTAQVRDCPTPNSASEDDAFNIIKEANSPAADKRLIEGFLREYLCNNIQLVAIHPDRKGDISAHYFGSDAQAGASWAYDWNDRGYNLYWSVNEVTPSLNKKASKSDVVAVRMLHVDIDPKKDGTPFDKLAVTKMLDGLSMSPSFVIDTGGGLGAFWVLDETVSDFSAVEQANRGLEAMFDGDHCHNIDRVMRVPGTVNYPNEAKRARGRCISVATIVQRDDGVRYPPVALLADLSSHAPVQSPPPPARFAAIGSIDLEPLTADDLGFGANSSVRSVIDYPAGDDRSRDGPRAAGDLLRHGLTEEQVIRVLCTPANAVAAHCLEQADPRRAATRIVEFINRKSGRDEALQAYLIDGEAISFDDLEAILPEHKYAYKPTGALWPAASVNGHMPSQFRLDRDGNVVTDDKGKPKFIPASEWLDKNKPCTQVTWAPGMPQIVEGLLFQDGAWVSRPDERVFNEYRPAPPYTGDAALAQPYVDHVRRVYSEEAEHILMWAAHRVQRPDVKINHALVLGGGQGIGKDTILSPIVKALGEWNCAEVSPPTILGNFNGFAKSVLLRVSEASDLGDSDRFTFYEHLKTLIAAPPESIRINQKHRQEYNIPNVCGVVITTNHKTDGIHLEPDDRRHFVCWSDLAMSDIDPAYFPDLYQWLDNGGYGHVAAYLHDLDISQFNPKAPPPKTDAFWAIVDAGRNPDDAQMCDAIERLGSPLALTIADVVRSARDIGANDFVEYLSASKNARKLSFRFEGAGYVRVANADAKDGCFKVNGRRTPVYAQRGLTARERVAAATGLCR